MSVNTVSKRILSRTGYLNDQQGILSRYLREQEEWGTHLQNTQKFIISAVEDSDAASIAILGSGWCLDVPVEFLVKNFERVYLVDLWHPQSVKHKLNKFENVSFISADMTGGLIQLAYNEIKKKTDLSTLLERIHDRPAWSLPVIAEYVVSVNVLNQLDILIVDYIKSKLKSSNSVFLPLRKKIQQDHLYLMQAGRSCMISDYEERQVDKTGRVVQKTRSLFIDFPEEKIQKKWCWKFDNCRSYHPKYNTELQVLAAKF